MLSFPGESMGKYTDTTSLIQKRTVAYRRSILFLSDLLIFQVCPSFERKASNVGGEYPDV